MVMRLITSNNGVSKGRQQDANPSAIFVKPIFSDISFQTLTVEQKNWLYKWYSISI